MENIVLLIKALHDPLECQGCTASRASQLDKNNLSIGF